jgi:hypothetical protein
MKSESGIRQAKGSITADQLRVISERIDPDLADLEARLRRLSKPRAAHDLSVDGITGKGARQSWEGMDLLTRRAVLETLGVRVRIMPTRPGPGFRPDDVIIEWAEPEAVAS